MQSPPGNVSPKVKRGEESQSGDDYPKVEKGEEPHHRDAFPEVKEECEFAKSSSPNHLENTLEKPFDVSPLGEEKEDEVQVIEVEDDQFCDNASNQLVLYNPEANGMVQIEPVPEPVEYQPPPFPAYAPNPPSRVLPSVGAFTVQCANCFKWRLIPTKEKYEEIRESILQQPFICERAREWRPTISCDDPADISQDGSRLWAIDKPNISQPPPGWERLLRIRGEGSTKFADVYYVAPSGKRLRSMVEVQKFLLEHPEHMSAGVTMSQFSFQIPKPLQENYVRKRPSRADFSTPRPIEPTEVNPLSWAGPIGSPDLQLGMPGMSVPYVEDPVVPIAPPAKRQATRSPPKHMYNTNTMYNQPRVKVEKSQPPSNSAYDL